MHVIVAQKNKARNWTRSSWGDSAHLLTATQLDFILLHQKNLVRLFRKKQIQITKNTNYLEWTFDIWLKMTFNYL